MDLSRNFNYVRLKIISLDCFGQLHVQSPFASFLMVLCVAMLPSCFQVHFHCQWQILHSGSDQVHVHVTIPKLMVKIYLKTCHYQKLFIPWNVNLYTCVVIKYNYDTHIFTYIHTERGRKGERERKWERVWERERENMGGIIFKNAMTFTLRKHFIVWAVIKFIWALSVVVGWLQCFP